MDVVWKAFAGGIVTALIALASKQGSVLPGILPLAPTFAVIALLTVGAKGDAEGFRTACLSGAKTIPAYLSFLLACYILSSYIDYRLAIVGGLIIWLVVAFVTFLAPRLL